jgi:thiol:disulfide interchange protein
MASNLNTYVRSRRACLLFLLWLGAVGRAHALPHSHARLVLAADNARPGEQVMAGIYLQIDPGWHIFWKNAGQPTLPTVLKWQLPPGITAGEIQWPIPKKHVDRDENSLATITYVYEDEVVLLASLNIASDAAIGSAELTAELAFQECNKTTCVNANAKSEATLQIGTESKPSADLPLITAWQNRLPKPEAALGLRGIWDKANAAGDTRPATFEWNSASPVVAADFFPYESQAYEVQPETKLLPNQSGKARLQILVKKTSGPWPSQISGVLVQGQETARVGYEAAVPMTEPGAAAAGNAANDFPTEDRSFLRMLLYAFVGGLLLNVMPCVLPVIALKILGFVRDAQNQPGRVRKLGIVYSLGVLVSFVGLALITLSLKAAGHAAGWGFQFGNPYFIVAMTTLVTLIALNLFGVFEITLSSHALTAASGLASKEGVAGAFFNGLLATVLATSCSAPLLAPAIGFASSLRSTGSLLLFWLTVGLGLAAPYLLLSFQPGWLRFLPRPGPWMNRFKVAMGFPMLGAAVWLCSIAAVHYGDRTWWIAAFLVFLAVAAWVYGEFVQRGSKHRVLALLLVLLLLGSGYFLALERQLDWRRPLTALASNGRAKGVEPRGLEWQAWSPEAVAAGRAASRPVVVDFTATWCPNCNIIVKPAFETAKVQKKLREVNALCLVADYSLPSPAITEELQRYQRDGVPLVLIYPRNASLPPLVFDLPRSSTIVKALDQAGEVENNKAATPPRS